MIYFSMGYWVAGLALITSFSGVACGLACIRQSTKSVTAKFRLVWVFVASVSIGGVGMAMPIYLLMLGFGVNGSPVRYESSVTSMFSVLAGLTMFIAMLVAGPRLNWWRLVLGALVMAGGFGTGDLLMLNAIRVQGSVERSMVSIIAVFVMVAMMSGLLLWFSRIARSVPMVLAGAVIYAGLVIAMHFVGFTGVQIHLDPSAAAPQGQELFSFFVPFFIIGTLALTVPITAILVAPDRREARTPVLPKPDLAHSPSLATASQHAPAQPGIRAEPPRR
ncbi:hypothetical protein [Nocardia sp. NBC_00511]|uniref:hypothetical protein n=1 Tax=Nocardia sp. NBC_00511 TaxID=2903591 RepID=UPI0030E165BB